MDTVNVIDAVSAVSTASTTSFDVATFYLGNLSINPVEENILTRFYNTQRRRFHYVFLPSI